jgi:hypothetical protein
MKAILDVAAPPASVNRAAASGEPLWEGALRPNAVKSARPASATSVTTAPLLLPPAACALPCFFDERLDKGTNDADSPRLE